MSHLVIGHVTSTSARIWVRGDKKSKAAKLRYRKGGTASWASLPPIPLVEHRGYVEVFEPNTLAPSTDYECELTYQSGPAPALNLGTFRTAPAAATAFSFFLGSCNWSRGGLIKIGDAKKSWEGIGRLVAQENPAFMVHCGDQIYSDVLTGPLPQFMHKQFYRGLYQKAWGLKPTAQVLAALPHYMILDDHEIFDDYYNGKPYAGQSSDPIAGFAKAIYTEYQHSRNPQDRGSAGFYFSFEHAGAKFFALDARTERHKGEHRAMIGVQQMAAFKKWLSDNEADVKFVVTAVPFVGEVRSGDDKWCSASFRDQRGEIIEHIAAQRIGRIVFLTGDMHASYHATMTVRANGGDLLLHELMSSPINQFGAALHQFRETADLQTPLGVRYRLELKPAEFYGKHSNVMKIGANPAGQISWDVFRTKDVTDNVLSGQFKV